MTTLVTYNHIKKIKTINKVVDALLQEEQLILPGGIMFCNKEIMIGPSCCCGLEDAQAIMQAISDKKYPWLGHDPFPTIEYLQEGKVKVWSEDYSREKLGGKTKIYNIEYDYKSLMESLRRKEQDFINFIYGPLGEYLKEMKVLDYELVMQKILKDFRGNYNVKL